ncbi:MAG: MerR family transcriptional regulator [Deltaproteobacteria bacterium]|nr:MerR family transcriptional regulator [Deltaproteobacteria bacterium]TLN03547.1 MAG: helix-turn-helix domain-containing protein [bacterium]
MSIAKTWFSVEDAESKFGVPKNLVLKWVEEGLIRCEQHGGKVTSVNGDDLALKLEEHVKNR